MKALKFALIVAGFVAGLLGASAAMAGDTNGNTNSGGGTIINASFSYIHCLYGTGGTATSCSKYLPKQVPEDPNPDDKTKG